MKAVNIQPDDLHNVLLRKAENLKQRLEDVPRSDIGQSILHLFDIAGALSTGRQLQGV